MNKYKNKKVVQDGITFDSLLEQRYYNQLLWLKKNGGIKEFVLQPKFELQPKFKDSNNKTVRAIEYIGDFKVINNDGTYEIVDCKGSKFVLTPVFKMKKKMFQYKYPNIPLKCLSYTKKNGWHEI